MGKMDMGGKVKIGNIGPSPPHRPIWRREFGKLYVPLNTGGFQ